MIKLSGSFRNKEMFRYLKTYHLFYLPQYKQPLRKSSKGTRKLGHLFSVAVLTFAINIIIQCEFYLDEKYGREVIKRICKVGIEYIYKD